MTKKNKILLLFLATIAWLILLHYFQLFQPIENKIIQLLIPINRSLFTWQKYINIFNRSKINSCEQVLSDNNKLQTDLTAQIVANNNLKQLQTENEILRATLNFISTRKFNYILANVIAHESDNMFYHLIIDLGSDDNIQVGYPVVDQAKLVGKIIEVNKNYSKVQLLTDINSLYSVRIQNQDSSLALIKGQHQTGLQLQLIPKTEKVELKQFVSTSGLDNFIPANILIGEIIEITDTQDELFQSAIVKPIANLTQLNIVTIIIP